MAKYVIKRGGMHDRFHQSRNKIQIIGGGFGNGKTAAACVKALQLVKDYPGCNGLIAMATFAQLNDTIREEVYKWVPDSAVRRWPTTADNTLHLKNGSKINFRYIKQKGKAAAADGQTSSNLLSATYDFAIVDQIENPEITYKDFLDLMGRLRGTTEYKGNDPSMPLTGPRWLILTANPSFNWVFHKLIKPMKHWMDTSEPHPDLIVDEDGKPLIDLFEAPTYENSHNLPADFIKGLEASYTGQFRDRFLGGEWGAFEGLVYPDFDRKTHMIDRNVMMRYLTDLQYRGLKPEALEGFDFGIASPSCYLYGFVDYYGRVFILDGFYAPGMTIPQIGDKINSMRLKYYPFTQLVKSMMADPAIFKRQVVQGSGRAADTISRMLLENHDIQTRAGQNDITSGIAKVASYLAMNNIPHFDGSGNNGRAIYFASELSFIADEFLSYFWQMSGGFERVDKPIDRNDHAMDTLKYMLSYLPDVDKLLYNTQQYEGITTWQQRMQQSLM